MELTNTAQFTGPPLTEGVRLVWLTSSMSMEYVSMDNLWKANPLPHHSDDQCDGLLTAHLQKSAASSIVQNMDTEVNKEDISLPLDNPPLMEIRGLTQLRSYIDNNQ